MQLAPDEPKHGRPQFSYLRLAASRLVSENSRPIRNSDDHAGNRKRYVFYTAEILKCERRAT